MDYSEFLKNLVKPQGMDEIMATPNSPMPLPTAPQQNAPVPSNPDLMQLLGVPQVRPDLVTPQNPPGLSPLLSPMRALPDSVNVPTVAGPSVPVTVPKPGKAAVKAVQAEKAKPTQELSDEDIVDVNSLSDKSKVADKAVGTAKKAEYSDDAGDLKKAQLSRDDFMSKLLMIQGADDVGRSIARVPTTNNQLFKDLSPMAQQKVADVIQTQDFNKKNADESRAKASESRAETAEERTAAKAPIEMASMQQNLERDGISLEAAKAQLKDLNAQRDPDSDVSKAARTLAAQMSKAAGVNLPIPENISYTQLEKLYPSVTKFIDTKMSTDIRRDAISAKKEDKEMIKTEKLDKRNQDFITNRSDALRKSKPYESLVKINNAMDSMEASIKQANAAGDVGALYQFIKALDSDSAVREGEIALANSGQSHIANIRNKLSKFGNSPRLMDPKFIGEMRDYMKAVQGAVAKQYRTTADTTLKQAKARGISEEDFSQIDPLYAPKSAATESKPQTEAPHSGKYPPGTVVTVKGKNYVVGNDGDSLTPQ